MSCREDQDPSKLTVDSLRFSGEHRCLQGRVALSELPRLSDLSVGDSCSAWLDYELQGLDYEVQFEARPALRLKIKGSVGLRCQRCLAETVIRLDIDKILVLIPEGAEWPEEELETDAFDAIPADSDLVVATLVEDEVLLALPIVPRHAECSLPAGVTGGGQLLDTEVSPFAILSTLKKH